MCPQKPANQDLSEAKADAIGQASQLEAVYEAAMDTMLQYVGRDVTLWLEPIRTASSSNPEHYDPFSGGQDRRLGNAETGEKGYTLEPVWVTYRAHVVHGPKEVEDPSTGTVISLKVGEVQLTTVYGALADVEAAVELEVDGQKYTRQTKDARPIGWSTPKYLITMWERKAEA